MAEEIPKEEREAIVEIKGKKYLHLFRGTSLEWLKKNEGEYIDDKYPTSYTTSIKVADEFGIKAITVGWTPIVIEIFVPLDEVDFVKGKCGTEESWAFQLPRLSKMFVLGSFTYQHEYITYWQVPLAWVKGIRYLKEGRLGVGKHVEYGILKGRYGKYVKNNKFNPEFKPEKTPSAAFSAYRYDYEKYFPEALKELKEIYTPEKVEKWYVEGFERYDKMGKYERKLISKIPKSVPKNKLKDYISTTIKRAPEHLHKILRKKTTSESTA